LSGNRSQGSDLNLHTTLKVIDATLEPFLEAELKVLGWLVKWSSNSVHTTAFGRTPSLRAAGFEDESEEAALALLELLQLPDFARPTSR
jgi:hypothetical protein